MKKALHQVSTVLVATIAISLAYGTGFAADSGGYGAPVPAAASPAAASPDFVRKMSDLLMKAPDEGHWQVGAADLAKMIDEKKADFVVVDVRPIPPGQQGGKIAGSIFIPYNEILTDANLKRLPRDKKVILACVTGQTQNLPVLALRALGYDAYTLKFGHVSWIKDYFGGDFMKEAIAGANYPTQP
jgi:rhodanese-related sulfurtransferase